MFACVWNLTGEENDVENGLANGMSADSEIDSDDDEILLPDDSHRSKHGHDVNSQYLQSYIYRWWECVCIV